MNRIYYPTDQRRYEILCYEEGSRNLIVFDHEVGDKIRSSPDGRGTKDVRVRNFSLEEARAFIDELIETGGPLG